MEAIRYSAPGRAGIIGNPSDMYGGSVICLRGFRFGRDAHWSLLTA
jgi:hypothetical protein